MRKWRFGVVVGILGVVAGPGNGAPVKDRDETKAFETERLQMVETQIRARGIRDPGVLRAMERVPRHLFVPEIDRAYAYRDHPLPIGHDQTISQPYIVALMTELLRVGPAHVVLEIGTGSGYQTAILAELARKVYSVEIVEALGRSAESLLESLGYTNVAVRIGDGYQGWPEMGPFDGIIVTAAPDTIPRALVEQLAEGGRLVIPVGSHDQQLMLLKKKDGKIIKKRVAGVRFVPMVGGKD